MAVMLAGKSLMKIGEDAGFTPYDIQSGCHMTSKLARFRMACGRPIVIQIDTKVAHVWLLTQHVTPRLASLGGKIKHYSATESRNHHLDQVREFRNQPVTNIELKATDPLAIHAAFIGH